MGRCSSVGIATELQAGRTGDRIPCDVKAGDTLSSRHVSSCDVKAGDTLSSRHVSSCDVKTGDTLSSRHVSSCDVKAGDTLSSRHVSSCDVKARGTLSSRHVSSCDVNACNWDVRGDLTLNSVVQIYTSVTLLTSRDLAWNSGRLTCQHASQIFAVSTHFVRRDVRVERSSDVTSCFQKWRKCLLKKCANGPFYMTPSHQIIEISI